MYKELSDDEIIYMIREYDDNLEIILEKYKPLINQICKKYLKLAKSVGMDFDDLVQIGNLSLVSAVRYYKDNQKTLFFTYVKRCIDNNIKTELRKELTNKKIVLNDAVSIDKIVTGTDKTLLDLLPDNKAINPIDYLIIEEKQIAYVRFINSLPLEVSVAFEMKVGGFSNTEISKFLHIDNNTVSKYANYVRTRLCLN